MSFWARYWSRLWELTRESGQPEETPEPDPGRERSPPVATRMVRSEKRGGGQARRRAAQARQAMPDDSRQGVGPSGRALPTKLRARLEAGLGIDLGSVRLRQDEAATRALDARAFTIGEQIVVGRPADAADLGLLSHEAAHVAQARSRGVREGFSKPGGATEHEARAADSAIRAGHPADLTPTGGPVPALQRDGPDVAVAGSPVVRREAVRMMLWHHYGQQAGRGPFTLTPELERELRRLIPGLTPAGIAIVWTPEPAGPQQAFQRLVDAGHLPALAPGRSPLAGRLVPLRREEPEPGQPAVPELRPQPEPERPPERERRVSPFGMGMAGLHFRVNPQVPAPASASIRQQLASRGITLSSRQLRSVLASRDRGIEQVTAALGALTPGMSQADRAELAETIADILLDASIEAHLEREVPTPLERFEAQIEGPEEADGGVLDLLRSIPIGASVTIYF